MDAKSQHARFRVLVEDIVDRRRVHSDGLHEKDWLILVYDELTEFIRVFPDRVKFNAAMYQIIADIEEIDAEIDDEVDRKRIEGLTYFDREFLKYEFPPS